MWEVAIHERSKRVGGGIAEMTCTVGAGKGKNFEDTCAHMSEKTT